MKLVTLIALALITATPSEAAITISKHKTKDENCTAGVCTPAGRHPNINVRDLKKMLVGSDVKIVTGQGSTGIGVLDPLTWTSGHRLTLDANQSIHIRAPIVVQGTGGVTLITNDGGTDGDFFFPAPGSLTFWDLSSSLIINGNTYVLVRDLKSLANAISTSPGGFYAFAASFEASHDHQYQGTVIPTIFKGTFEGLGNAIQRLHAHVSNGIGQPFAGLFLESDGTLRDIALPDVGISGNASNGYAAALAVFNYGTIIHATVTGKVAGIGNSGGLVGANAGIISQSNSGASVLGFDAGGLASVNVASLGAIDTSFATGTTEGKDQAGGLVAINQGQIEESYATGRITSNETGGGLVGKNSGTISQSYATGFLYAGFGGGLIGVDTATDAIQSAYWDMDTSQVYDPHQGAGQPLDDPGITGLTDAQLKSALPAGFDPNIWGQSASINNGWPYLLANPPPQ